MNNTNTRTSSEVFYTSVIGPFLQFFINSERAKGNSCSRIQHFFRIIDEYCNEQRLAKPCFTKQFINAWIETLSACTKYEKRHLLHAMRKFSAYLSECNEDSYVLPIPEKKAYEPQGILAPFICEFVEMKRSQGLKYIGAANALKSFDKYSREQGLYHLCDVTETFIEQWHHWKTTSPSQKNYSYAVRELLIFMKTSKGLSVTIPNHRFKKGQPCQEIVFHSALASLLDDFLAQKIACGFKYETERAILKFFDLLCVEFSLENPVLTREIVQSWSIQRPNEGASYRVKRVSIIRQFALFLLSRGCSAYMAPVCPSAPPVKAHIFCDEELVAFFTCCDHYKADSPLVRLTLPVIFRFYYCLGLRLSEASNLRCEDINLDIGRVDVRMAKGLKDRIVYLPEDLLVVAKQYNLEVGRKIPWRESFFVTDVLGTPFHRTSLNYYFSKIWNMTGYAEKVDKKPTIHSFRYTMVARKLEEWYEKKEDYTYWLPYLSAFLGHASLKETYYYIALVNSSFALIREGTKQFEALYPQEAIR